MTDFNARLLDSHELALLGPPEAVRIPLDLVDPNPRNPRQNLVELDALADNIARFGLLQPVTVRRAGERYELLGGHRRRAAFAVLRERFPIDPQWRTIPAVIKSADDDESELMLISGQVHSRGWRPKEEAYALERLVLAGRTAEQVGQALNKTKSWASKRLRVYSDAVLSGFVQSGQLLPGVADVFVSVKDPDVRRDLAERAVAEQWNQPRAQTEVRKLRLEVQLRDLGRRVEEMIDVLSAVEPSRIPIEVYRNLSVLRGRIEQIAAAARGDAGPRFPTIEQAQRRAGLKPGKPAPKRRTRLRLD